MKALAAVREAIRRHQGTAQTCFGCVNFCDDPARVERDLPGLAALSSAHASVRAQDGLCLLSGLVINGRRRCAAFATHEAQRNIAL